MENMLTLLKNIKYDLDMSSYQMSLKEKLEILGDLYEKYLDEIIQVLDDGVDRINELEKELNEANERIEELEE